MEAGGSAQREFERRKAEERTTIKRILPCTIPLVIVLSIGAGLLSDRVIGSLGWLAALIVAAYLGLMFWSTTSPHHGRRHRDRRSGLEIVESLQESHSRVVI